jgi:DinB family protein
MRERTSGGLRRLRQAVAGVIMSRWESPVVDSEMHEQLQAIVDEFDSAGTHLYFLGNTVPLDGWRRRPEPGRWSVGECVAHLNLTSLAYLPILDEALAEARRLSGPARVFQGRYRRDVAGWFLWKTMGPPVRVRVKTTAAFVPAGSEAPIQLIAEFERLQAEQIARVRNADGLPIDRIKIASPFNARVKYNLYACLTMLPRHQHRHLWQAEQAWLKVKG